MMPLLIPRLASLNLLLRGFHIRRGRADDINACDAIARRQEKRWRSSLGWVRKDDYQTFHVACFSEFVVGFVIYHACQRGIDAGYTLIGTLATDERYEGLGIGRNLLYSVPTPLRLRCPQFVNGVQENPSNAFYRSAGLVKVGTESEYRGGTKRGQVRANPLNVWQLSILPILVMGSNQEMPEVARKTGWGYGTREIETPRDWPYQVDIDLEQAEGDWRAYDWKKYLAKIKRWKPFSALAVDYFEPDQKETMLEQIADLKAAGVERVLVCPKFDGAVRDIPDDCIVAISIPSRYAGFIPPLSELRGRRLHLLGGSPLKWFGSRSGRRNRSSVGYISVFQGAGAQVVSVDGNSHEAYAQTGTFWIDGHAERPAHGGFLFGNRFKTMVVSGKNIGHDLHTSASFQQSALFGET